MMVWLTDCLLNPELLHRRARITEQRMNELNNGRTNRVQGRPSILDFALSSCTVFLVLGYVFVYTCFLESIEFEWD